MDEHRSWASLRGVVRRRRRLFLWAFLPILLTASAVAFLLPALYVARTTILIEGQQIPAEYVRATITTFVDERLQALTQQIMSSTRLLELISRFDLYRDLKDSRTTEEILQTMRKAIRLETISADVADRRSGQQAAATIAFSVSYEGKDPGTVQKVANALASLYLEENAKTRGRQASNTTEFLQQELDTMKQQVDELERKISDFKKTHVGQLPEYTAMNIQLGERARTELDQLTAQIAAAQERKLYLEGQLALVDRTLPDPLRQGAVETDSVLRLKALRLQLNALRAKFADSHPDVVRLKREVATLEALVGQTDDSQEKQKRLRELRAELEALRAKLGPQHPDVLTRAREAEALARDLASSPNADLGGGGEKERDNPAYVTLRTQIASADLEISNLLKEKRKLGDRSDEYQRKLGQAPGVERDYVMLTRDYENAQLKYKELMNKLMEARVAQGMEETQRGERFTIIDAAQLPEKPSRPDRPTIVLIGLVLALGIGGGLAAAAEGLDPSIKGVDDLESLTTLPVLTALPLLSAPGDTSRFPRARLAVFASVALALGVASLVVVHLYVTPVDVLWAKVERQLLFLLPL